MTIADMITQSLYREKDLTMTTKEIYEDNSLLSKGGLRSALSRMVKKGKLERVARGTYQLIEEIYREFTHSKRITSTNKKNPQHEFNGEIELTASGLAPGTATLQEVDDVVNPKLLDRGFEMLDEEGIYLYEAVTNYEVIGTEETIIVRDQYNSLWNVSVKFTNESGSIYVFDGYMEVAESEWR